MTDQIDWKSKLTPEEYRVCREQGTEAPFSGEYNHNPLNGDYHCKCCDVVLFNSADKFDSGCGWPSFDQPGNEQSIRYIEDESHGMRRVETRCSNCDSHLGHVFEDGPRETTGKRFCINSLSLDFKEDK